MRLDRSMAWIAWALMVASLAACSGPSAGESDPGPSESTPRPTSRPDVTPPVDTSPETTPTTAKTPDPKEMVAVADAALGRPVTVSGPPNRLYPAEGAKSLVDGRMGSEDYYDPEWMGWWYEDKPFEATVDLGQVVAVDEVGVHVLTLAESWIFYPRSVEFELSNDGKTFRKVAKVSPTAEELGSEYPDTKILKAMNLDEKARYVRVRAERYGELPDWHLGYGGADGYEGQAWLFLDEILVNPRSR